MRDKNRGSSFRIVPNVTESPVRVKGSYKFAKSAARSRDYSQSSQCSESRLSVISHSSSARHVPQVDFGRQSKRTENLF